MGWAEGAKGAEERLDRDDCDTKDNRVRLILFIFCRHTKCVCRRCDNGFLPIWVSSAEVRSDGGVAADICNRN